MITTAIFVEILIIGFQAIVWLGMIAYIILGEQKIEWAQLNTNLKDWSGLATIVVFGLAYTLGVRWTE